MLSKKIRNTTKTTSRVLVPVTASVVTTTSTRRNKKKRNRRRRKTASVPRLLGLSGSVEMAWLKSLNNPFDHLPLPIGLGTMIPTEVVTAYKRDFITPNADGSFQLWLNPGLIQNVTNNTTQGAFVTASVDAAGTTPTFTYSREATNRPTLAAAFDQYRVLSAGIRVIHTGAFNVPSGILASGLYPQDSDNFIPCGTLATTKQVNSALTGLPMMDWSRTIDPLQVTWRPSDLGNFQFNSIFISTGSNITNIPPSICIASTGAPVAAVFYEAICHIECYNVSKGLIAGNNLENANPTSSFETIGGMYQSISSFLEPVSQSVIEWAKEASVTAATTALGIGLEQAKSKIFRGMGHGALGSYPSRMMQELKYNG